MSEQNVILLELLNACSRIAAEIHFSGLTYLIMMLLPKLFFFPFYLGPRNGNVCTG